MDVITIVLDIVLTIYLLICMVFDLRTREVPLPLTLAGLVGAGVYALFKGLWSPVLLTIALSFLADHQPRARRLVLALTITVFAGLFQPSSVVMSLAILWIWLLWEVGAMGGADTKLLLAEIMLMGNPVILIPILLTGGIQGLMAMFQKKKEIPFVVSIFCGSLFYFLSQIF